MPNNRKSTFRTDTSPYDANQQIPDPPTTLLTPQPDPVTEFETTDSDILLGRIPTLPLPPSQEQVRHTTYRHPSVHASVAECARKAEEWRQVVNYLKVEIAKLDERISELRHELTYAEVQAASYDQAIRTLMRTQFPSP